MLTSLADAAAFPRELDYLCNPIEASSAMSTQLRAIALAIHGMGPTASDYADRLRDELQDRLDSDSTKVYFSSIYYQDVFQEHQNALWNRYSNSRLDWVKARKLLLYGFSDAAGYERKAEESDSSYEQVQQKIRGKLEELYHDVGPVPIVLIAQSLGGHVISNYIWDAQKDGGATRGIWQANGSGHSEDERLDAFLRLKSLAFFYTTGCNIPVFVADLPEDDIEAIQTRTRGYNISWKNYFDVDDALGWPLQPLSDSYKQAIALDRAVSVGGLLTGWNPLSHSRYWTDRDVLRPLVTDIRALISVSTPASSSHT